MATIKGEEDVIRSLSSVTVIKAVFDETWVYAFAFYPQNTEREENKN
jgi:hypothetical protein